MSKFEIANKIAVETLESFNKGLYAFNSGLSDVNKKMHNYIAEKETDENYIKKKNQMEEFQKILRDL
ncbi:hypothetical protein [Shewanella xiamenensis]|uniref:hypothetical protein n=1 Tax=Shewanella xiamenensis TaxID=332186 RepID=UPI0015595407|nr:hypothetical protein [Shewanella xiamenensis]